MTEHAQPALRFDRVVVRARMTHGAGAVHTPRDLPNLARYLMDAVAAEPSRAHKLVDRVSLEVAPGERLVLLGEEGCGKTTVARACARMIPLDSGSITVGGVDVAARNRGDALTVRRKLQVIFDDDEAGLDPRRTVTDALAEAFDALALARDGVVFTDRAARAMGQARFPADAAAARARDLSAGMRARASLARALLAEPDVIVIDEPTARLDPLERAQLLEALAGLAPTGDARGGGPAVVALTQRPDVARAVAQRVGVLYLGALVEIGGPDVLDTPCHPYVRGLLASAPQRSRPANARAIAGELPPIAERPPGCPYHPRCPDAIERCATERPALVDGARAVACHVVNRTAAG